MKEFRIEQYELHVQTYFVKAGSQEEAIAKLQAGEAECEDNAAEYLEPATQYGDPPCIRSVKEI